MFFLERIQHQSFYYKTISTIYSKGFENSKYSTRKHSLIWLYTLNKINNYLKKNKAYDE